MKQALLLIVSVVFVTVLRAQSPTLTSIINYGIGDKQITLTADTTGIEPGPAGINQTWDFSKLKRDSAMDSSIVNYIDPKKTQYSAAFKTANVAGEIAYKGGVSYTFYDMTNAAIDGLGNAGYDSSTKTSNGVKFTNALTQLAYPVQYGYNHAATYNTTPFGNNAAFSRSTYNVNADAFGSMKIRNTQYDSVLRLKVTQVVADSIPLGGGSGSFMFYDSITSYEFYCPGKKSPILTISYTPKVPYGKRVTFNDFDHVRLTAIAPEKNENISFSLFPNPAKNLVQISLILNQSSEAEITIVNELGQAVKSLQNIPLMKGANNFNLDLGGMPHGIYFVNLISNGQMSRQKLVVD